MTDGALQRNVDEGDYEELVFVMSNLFAVRERQSATDEMFEPLKQTIELLKTYDQEMPEEVHLQLQVWLLHILVMYDFQCLSFVFLYYCLEYGLVIGSFES